MKNCATCKFMNFRCKGKCENCVHKVDNPSGSVSHRLASLVQREGDRFDRRQEPTPQSLRDSSPYTGVDSPMGEMSVRTKGARPVGPKRWRDCNKGGVGVYFGKEEIEEKCKCIECYDEDSGKYRYWVGEPELMKYFEGAE